MSIDPVAAIPERSATGEIAQIYGDIRHTLGVDVVNLVWRHLATIDGALPWAWQAVRPAYVSGAVRGAAERMKAALQTPQLVKVPSDVLSAAGLDADNLATVRTILASYDHSNAMNYLALTALVHARPGAQSACDTPGATAQATDSIGEMPELPSLEGMAPDMRELLVRLNGLGESDDAWIMVSMYRHLSYWPGSLALVWALLAPLAADGRLQGAAETIERSATTYGAQLAGAFAPAPVHQAGQQALQDFLDRVRLPKMIVITRLLLDATAEDGGT